MRTCNSIQSMLRLRLSAQGAASVSAYVTHGVFPNATYERFSPQGNGASADGFKYFWITDSCANTANALRDRPPFEVRCVDFLQSGGKEHDFDESTISISMSMQIVAHGGATAMQSDSTLSF